MRRVRTFHTESENIMKGFHNEIDCINEYIQVCWKLRAPECVFVLHSFIHSLQLSFLVNIPLSQVSTFLNIQNAQALHENRTTRADKLASEYEQVCE